MRSLLPVFAASIALAGCASSPTPRASTTTASVEAKPCADRPDAQRTLDAFAAKHPLSPADEPLRSPKSLDDVEAILKLDQIDLFDGAAAFASRQTGNDALALGAQIEIAHAEAQLVVADVLDGCAKQLEVFTRTLRFREQSGATSGPERAVLAELAEAEHESTEVGAALRELAATHAKRGMELARSVVGIGPKGYRGFRIAADFHRLRRDWPSFVNAVQNLEAAAPESNGLVFLRALAAEAVGEDGRAELLLAKAIERDGRFVRAQAHRVRLQRTPDRAYAELQKLVAMNPRHQVVAFAGPYIVAAQREGAREAPTVDPQTW